VGDAGVHQRRNTQWGSANRRADRPASGKCIWRPAAGSEDDLCASRFRVLLWGSSGSLTTNVRMYVHGYQSQSDGQQYGGGAQDNGSILTSDGKPDDFTEVLGGDGGWMVFDAKDAAPFYGSYYNFPLFRWKAGTPKEVTPKGVTSAEHSAVWMVYIVMDPNDSNTVYTASYRVW